MAPRKRKLIKRVSVRFYQEDKPLIQDLERYARRKNLSLNDLVLQILRGNVKVDVEYRQKRMAAVYNEEVTQPGN